MVRTSVHRDTAHELIRSLAVMTMTFFLNVTDTGTSQCFSAARCATQRIVGSWLEIGQTISFFCISSMLLVFSAGVCGVGEMLMADVFVPPVKTPKKSD